MVYRYFGIGLCILLVGCGTLDPPSASLFYTIRVEDAANQTFAVELIIRGTRQREIPMRLHTFDEFTEVEAFQASHSTGQTLNIDSKEEKRRVVSHELTTTIRTISALEKEDIKILYRVRIGKEIHANHGVQSFQTYGYMNERFGLVSGRSLFMLPDMPIVSAHIRFKLPDSWQVAVPWESHQGWFKPEIGVSELKEELVNTNIALGLLEYQTKKVSDTEVSVYVFRPWERAAKDSLYQRAFATYASVANLFGGDGDGKYVFSFVPKTNDDLFIANSHWSSSQGFVLRHPNFVNEGIPPPGAQRWLTCIEKLMDRWIKYPPYRMTFRSQDDYWVTTGIQKYFAVKIGGQLGFLNARNYLAHIQKRFPSVIGEVTVHSQISKPLPLSPPLLDVRQLYTSHSNARRRKREAIAPFALNFLDDKIQNHTFGKKTFIDVLKYQYQKRESLDLFADIGQVIDDQFAQSLKPMLQDLGKLAREANVITEESKLPSFYVRQTDVAQLDTLRFLFTGNTKGFLEHCGCKVNQNGGVARRATVIERVRSQFPDVLLLDTGNFTAYTKSHYRLTPLMKGEFKLYLDAMEAMDYDLAAVSFYELFYGEDLFLEQISSRKFPVVCANVLKDGKPISRPHVSIQAGKYRIGFLGIFEFPLSQGDRRELTFEERTSGLVFLDPVATIRKYLPALRRDNDLVVLIGAISPQLIQEEIVQFEGVDMIISTEKHLNHLVESPNGMKLILNDLSGVKGEMLVIYDINSLYAIDLVEITVDQDGIVQGWVTKKTLGEDVEDQEMVRSLIDNFYTETVAMAADVKPLMQWHKYFQESDFVGADACKTCHPSQHEQWKTTEHATAFNTLLDAKRQYQPDCVKCHVTGAGHQSGYQFGNVRHPLINVQCEMCHGPGSQHVTNPIAGKMIRTPSKQLCTTCHDQEHSDFVMEEYYPKVKHSIDLAEKATR